jgi:hypothetical protein
MLFIDWARSLEISWAFPNATKCIAGAVRDRQIPQQGHPVCHVDRLFAGADQVQDRRILSGEVRLELGFVPDIFLTDSLDAAIDRARLAMDDSIDHGASARASTRDK